MTRMPRTAKKAASLLVVNIRGTINVPAPVKDTLRRLRLDRRYSATVVPDSPVYRGMLNRLKNHAAWCPAEPEIVEKILKLRGRPMGKKTLGKEELEKLGSKSLKTLAKAVSEGTVVLGRSGVLRPVFRLAPPRGGFRRSTKHMHSQGGVTGENPDLPAILEAMI